MRASPCLMLLISSGCGWTSQPPASSQPAGYFDSYESKWPQKELTVCWEDDSSSERDLGTYQDIVRDVVTTQYQKAGFTFSGWTLCSKVSRAHIRVWVHAATWPKVNAFGRTMDNLPRGLELTFDFLAAGNGWGALCQHEENLSHCIRNYALHEFGHALGLKHEADRQDASCEQKTYSPGIEIGGYDQLSIMNYCNNEAEVRANHYPKLSYNDVATLLEVYHSGTAESTFTAIAWSPRTGAYGTSWHWTDQGAAFHTALGNCEQYGQRPDDCQVVAWAQDACAAFAVGQNKGYGWAWNTDREAAKATAMSNCQQYDSGCQTVAVTCSED